MNRWEYLAAQSRTNSLFFAACMFEAVKRQPFAVAWHHKEICRKLDEVLSGTHPTNRLILNIPPRHSKTELAVVSFAALGFGINPSAEFMHLSASDDLITRNVTNIRAIVDCAEYRLMFPDTELSNTAKGSITTTKGGVLHAAPFMGQITGFGCGKLRATEFAGAMLIDDPMKAQDSLSDTIKQKINRLWSSTLASRLNDTRTPVIVTAQRLALDDFCGHLIEQEGAIEQGGAWDVVRFPAILGEGSENERALWEARNPLSELIKRRDATDDMTRWDFQTQYMQNPSVLEGLMYQTLRTYDYLPDSGDVERKNYTDTADTGSDFLCSICYIETTAGCYVTDVLYTKRPMEWTEPATAKILADNDTQKSYIESNNGGRGFARNVEKLSRERGNTQTRFELFTQRDNKQSRIFSASAAVQNIIFFPSDWAMRWPEFARDVKSYRKEGGNAHDDAPDVLSGIVEKFGNKGGWADLLAFQGELTNKEAK